MRRAGVDRWFIDGEWVNEDIDLGSCSGYGGGEGKMLSKEHDIAVFEYDF